MKAQFEEKTYETYMNFELVSEEHIFYAPGQMKEYYLGFDVALQTKNEDFWRLFHHYPPIFPYSGFEEGEEFWQLFEQQLSRIPRFKYNCFIQYKRPTFLQSSSCKEFDFWRKPYFRYDITPHQQNILFTIANHYKNKALVVYACPAFSTSEELTNYYLRKLLVNNSNFCEVNKLQSHHRYSFVEPGVVGCAHSDMEPIEGIPFKEQLRKLSGSESGSQNLGNEEFIIQTAKTLDIVMKELSNPFSYSYNKLVERAEHYIGITRLYLALYKIFTFQVIMDVQIFFGY